MVLQSIFREFEQYELSQELFGETNFNIRDKALETIRIIRDSSQFSSEIAEPSLTQRLENLETLIHSCNRSIYLKYHGMFQDRKLKSNEIREVLNQFTSYKAKSQFTNHYDSDDLDYLVDGVLNYNLDNIRLPKRSSEYHHLEATPAKVILDLMDQMEINKNDVFYDFGSGLGHVVILVHMLAGAKCVGIEIESSYCELANQNISSLNLNGVTIQNADVLEVDYDKGNIFFFYSPFSGKLLDDVMNKLRLLAMRKQIFVCTFGPITMDIAKLDWLTSRHEQMIDPFRLAIFDSRLDSRYS